MNDGGDCTTAPATPGLVIMLRSDIMGMFKGQSLKNMHM